MKKTAVLCLFLLLCCLASAEEANRETFASGDYQYALLDDGTVEITKYTGEDAELSIHAALNGHRVTGIGDDAFSRCRSLTNVTIPEGVIRIGDYAFDSCSHLTSITLPESLTGIGDHAFILCNSLTSVTIPDSVIRLGENPFACCEKLTRILVSPEHPTLKVMDGALVDKSDMRLICYPYASAAAEYAIPPGIRLIGDSAFFFCDALKRVTIPEGVTEIGNWAFASCDGLISVTIPDGVAVIGENAFYTCGSLTSVTIPDSVKSIGDDAFASCDCLTNVIVGRGSCAERYCMENGLKYTYSDAHAD